MNNLAPFFFLVCLLKCNNLCIITKFYTNNFCVSIFLEKSSFDVFCIIYLLLAGSLLSMRLIIGNSIGSFFQLTLFQLVKFFNGCRRIFVKIHSSINLVDIRAQSQGLGNFLSFERYFSHLIIHKTAYFAKMTSQFSY